MTDRRSRLLVVGIGNPLRGDDGVGPAIVERVAALDRPTITTRVVRQLLPEMAEELSCRERVVFVDCSRDLPAGDWRFELVDERSPPAALSHYFPPAAVLAMTERLFGVRPTAWCLRVGGSDFEFEERLSPPVLSIMDVCVRQIVETADAESPANA